MQTTQKFYKDQTCKIYFKFNSVIEPKVYELVDNEFIFISNMTKIPNSSLWFFETIKSEIGEYIYKIKYDDRFEKYFKLVIEEPLLSELYNMQFGNWEIKDNSMYFYDLSGSLIAKYNLFDRKGSPTEISPVKRVKV